MTLASVLSALAAIPAIVGYVESAAAAITAWYIQRQTINTLSGITDAIALLGSAQSDQDRFNAISALQKSLSAPRIISG